MCECMRYAAAAAVLACMVLYPYVQALMKVAQPQLQLQSRADFPVLFLKYSPWPISQIQEILSEINLHDKIAAQ